MLLCQTEGFKALWQALVPELTSDKVRLYTPVIPDLCDRIPQMVERPIRAVYAGKFKGDWMTLDMAESWPVIHRQVPGSELVIIGDKIHNEPDPPNYQQRMRHVLENTEGLTWLGAQPREYVQHQLQQARVGLSWRAESMNDTLEYSTKILEYGGAGCAVILNRNPLHEQLLGKDYPLFANSIEEFTHQLVRALGEPEVAEQAACTLRHLAGRHTFSNRVAEIRQWLMETHKKSKCLREPHNSSIGIGKIRNLFGKKAKVVMCLNLRHKFVKTAKKNRRLLVKAANLIKNFGSHHNFLSILGTVFQWLMSAPKRFFRGNKIRVLVAGHDLKFFAPLQKKLEATGQFEFLIDKWQGHNRHDQIKSLMLLKQADVIFCEWCLGNLKWYSYHKKPKQRLVARFHLQEREFSYVAESNWENIDHISYVSEFIRREGQKKFGFPYEKTSVIPNLLDDEKFTSKKKIGDSRYTLGIIGIAPARKRLDRALDLLELLLEEDSRYCLRIKGKNPLEYSWLVNRKNEFDYYCEIFKRINSNSKLRYRVIFDPPGDDVNEWFTMVGFILSPSDFESFHMSIGEGILTKSKPIIWNWDGAKEIWGEENVFEDESEILLAIKEFDDRSSVTIPEHLMPSKIVDLWSSILRR